MTKALLPMNLQFFADPAPAAGGDPAPGASGAPAQGGAPAFDYEKLASLIQGKQTVAEDTVLKNYFKQQGLSQEEAAQAIQAFKQQKAQNQPDVTVIQGQLTDAQTQLVQAQAAARQAQLEGAATMMAVSLGIDGKTIPYVLKMADLSSAMDKDGKINDETLKAALNKVLEDVPALKPKAEGGTGFTQIGTGGNPSQQAQGAKQNQAAVATKKWNRFN